MLCESSKKEGSVTSTTEHLVLARSLHPILSTYEYASDFSLTCSIIPCVVVIHDVFPSPRSPQKATHLRVSLSLSRTKAFVSLRACTYWSRKIESSNPAFSFTIPLSWPNLYLSIGIIMIV